MSISGSISEDSGDYWTPPSCDVDIDDVDITITDVFINEDEVELTPELKKVFLNIVNSKGNLADIKIFNSYSDAIDIDFSNISINKIAVNKAGNDCFDVSGGSYRVSNIYLNKCLDKGVSVGEGSTLFATNMELNNANIGVSSKDLSKVEILNVSSHKFEPQGFTLVALLSESHFSFHTFPEKGIISFDFFTCGKISPSVAIDIIKKEFKHKRIVKKEFNRDTKSLYHDIYSSPGLQKSYVVNDVLADFKSKVGQHIEILELEQMTE